METRANYVLIGTFTLVTTVLLLLFALWASNFSAARNWREYMVVFTEPVTGLTEGGSVQYNGLAVGTVESLNLDDNDARRVIARLKLKANTPVKTDTRAKLSQQGITGVPFIQLTGGSPNAPALQASADGQLPVIRTEPSALQNIADTANRLVARLDQVLSEDNIRRISQTLEHLEQASGSIAGRRQEIGELIVNARDATAAMKTTLAHADGAIQDLDRNLVQRLPALLDKLDAVVTKLDATAGNANAMIAENRPALQSFTSDGLAQLGPTLVELRALMRDLRALSGRLEGNPARYILGRDAPKEFDPK
ncbi:MAG: ABC transporter substrate-binding protein [Lysobacteraceae bacterium SCN 69-48]|jgi:phospholipid/cholesterol/gamma-HCH transport system substrate-binding protein|nr:MAG: ABC transporter substrate-binding protein [Xanthomonadaceae bacterium SCN 69-48]